MTCANVAPQDSRPQVYWPSLQRAQDPVRVRLRDDDLQVGEPLEDATEDQRRQQVPDAGEDIRADHRTS